MNCIIVDDEELAHHVIEEYISRIPFLNLVANCYDIQETIQVLKNNTVDLIFLDINLPNISGIEFLKSYNKLPNVIITTAYDNCAIQGFEMDVIDYLLKPFSFERFLKAAYKSFDLYNNVKILQETESVMKNTFIFVRSNNEDVKLNLNEIIRINALKDYIVIYTNTRKLIVHQTMKSIMEKINFENFIRVHNSHIISLQHLQSVGKNSLMIGDERIPVSEKYKTYLSGIVDRYK
ncbi:LytR/AlgR family response regulator transcription factor [Epilithonimonas hungarica]|uniref:Two component transcriptional regulator, LytTR family n=1 Tax=Epilithonimonas hungarica TaxID=454006 RepID=A0A1G7GEP1_9FLAO|nr:LytTR family DNA-binding domain-containing protein [Epilithonimonas hungarica]MDP9956863.1 DNA-binding LytR/AlgR family response regulator [Epilithonimonas hungarica]MPT31344.1 response regulator transcription factor [Chryseobacterium sp.]SDE86617.1 two component transcriptional regulator, LytTR family [Epilithonimonas hungarica]